MATVAKKDRTSGGLRTSNPALKGKIMLKTTLLAVVCTAVVLPLQADEIKLPAPTAQVAPTLPTPPANPSAPVSPSFPARRDKRGLTEEQKSVMKEIRERYDANKDGKLDATERKSISAEDKERLNKAGLGAVTPRKKRDKEKDTE
jgi:hypothetical protein